MKKKVSGAGGFFKRAYLGLVLLFLYAPILTLIVFSFNAGDRTPTYSARCT